MQPRSDWRAGAACHRGGGCRDGVRELRINVDDYHPFTLVESLCLPRHHITVLLDSVSVQNAHFTLSHVPACDKHSELNRSPPCRLHYGYATESATWNEPQDACFDSISHSCFVTRVSFPQRRVIGVSFVIQLQDGQWLKDYDGADFYVGTKHRRSPACVEVPLASPCPRHPVQFSRLTSLYKQSPFWIAPEMHQPRPQSLTRGFLDLLSDVMHETVFALIEATQPSHPQNAQSPQQSCIASRLTSAYTALIFVADARYALRTTLFSTGSYPAIRIESGKRAPLPICDVLNAQTCFMLSAPDVYAAVSELINYMSHRLTHFCSRRQKVQSPAWPRFLSKEQPLLNSLGFCTWDAFGHDVTQANIVEAMEWFQANEIPFGYLVLDDGWQAGGGKGPNFEHFHSERKSAHRPCLQAYGPNDKFDTSLEALQRRISVPIMAWTAAIGYWGGTDGRACGVETNIVRGAVSRGLLMNNIGNLRHWEKLYEVPLPSARNIEHFFHSYFVSNLAATHKLNGLKIDAQSILEILHDATSIGDASESKGSQSKSLTASYRSAMTKAVGEGFPRTIVVNSMACGQEAVFASGSTLSSTNICWRTSDDHAFPNMEENADMVTWHILRNAMNTLMLGEIFPVSDWDMFTAHHELARMHAIARVLSGGPLCISDSPAMLQTQGMALLKSLLTSDGKILRCEEPGRPTVDCIFEDPRKDPTKLFKVFNRSSVNGVIGVFNLHKTTKDSNISGLFAPCDVYPFSKTPGAVSYLSMISGPSMRLFLHKNQFDPCPIQVPTLDALIAHITPIFNISSEMQFAAIGNPRLLNAGAVVASIAIKSICWETDYEGIYEKLSLSKSKTYVVVNVSLRDSGDAVFWLNDNAICRLSCLTHVGSTLNHFRYETISELKLLFVTVPTHGPCEVDFVFEDP